MVEHSNVLETKALVKRIRNETDRREYQVILTAEGEHVLAKGKLFLQEIESNYLQKLSDTEQQQLQYLLNKTQ